MGRTRSFVGGFNRGFSGGLRTGRRLLNTATLGALDQGINTLREGVTKDLKPLEHVFRPQFTGQDSEKVRNSSDQRRN